MPGLLHDVLDVVACTFDTKGKQQYSLILPTFTFPIGLESSNAIPEDKECKQSTVHQRFHSNKRTPSWTDQILIHKALLSDEGNGNDGSDIQSINAYYGICSSDHVPVSCSIYLSPTKINTRSF